MFRGYWRVRVTARRLLKPVRPVIYMQMREPKLRFVRGSSAGPRRALGTRRGRRKEGNRAFAGLTSVPLKLPRRSLARARMSSGAGSSQELAGSSRDFLPADAADSLSLTQSISFSPSLFSFAFGLVLRQPPASMSPLFLRRLSRRIPRA